jgi:hypothetical protein
MAAAERKLYKGKGVKVTRRVRREGKRPLHRDQAPRTRRGAGTSPTSSATRGAAGQRDGQVPQAARGLRRQNPKPTNARDLRIWEAKKAKAPEDGVHVRPQASE